MLPLSNPKTSAMLLEMAVAIARDRNYEIEVLQVIVVPNHQALVTASVKTAASQQLLKQAVRLGQAWQIPVHTQIRVAHDLSSAILEILKERHIDLLVMGWKGSTTTPGRVFSRVVDTMIRQSACELVLIKLNSSLDESTNQAGLNRWLVPMAGGPNAQEAVQLLPALVPHNQAAQVQLFHVYDATEERRLNFDKAQSPNQTDSMPNPEFIQEAAQFLKHRIKAPIVVASVCADSIPAAVLNYAKQDQSDVIILGASREGLLQQVQNGNIPAVISRQSNCHVILVRGTQN